VELYINDLKQAWNDDFSIAPGQTVRLVARYPISAEAQRGISGWTLSAGDRTFEFRLPPGDDSVRAQSAIYTDPVPPSPTPGMEAAMRALEGVYSIRDVGEMTLRYDGGLLRGETRLRAGQPVLQRLTLAMPSDGTLKGLMEQPNNPPGSVWHAVDLSVVDAMDVSVMANRARLQGDSLPVHPPINTPRPFLAVRTSAPAPAPAPAPTPRAPSAELARFAGTLHPSPGPPPPRSNRPAPPGGPVRRRLPRLPRLPPRPPLRRPSWRGSRGRSRPRAARR